VKNTLFILLILVWAACGAAGVFAGRTVHNILAAKRTPDAELQLLRDLYLSGSYRDLLDELNVAQSKGIYYRIRAPMLYLKFLSFGKLGDYVNSREVMDEFLHDYPGDPLCANIHLDLAYDHLRASDYKAASRELRLTTEEYPTTAAAKDALKIVRGLPAEQ
jgi:hypothetical protein